MPVQPEGGGRVGHAHSQEEPPHPEASGRVDNCRPGRPRVSVTNNDRNGLLLSLYNFL